MAPTTNIDWILVRLMLDTLLFALTWVGGIGVILFVTMPDKTGRIRHGRALLYSGLAVALMVAAARWYLKGGTW